jgi:hypothetical protein
MAALVNGTMVRYLDMSDAHLRLSAAHPSDNIPGLMAIAEITGASGKDLMLAIAISYEVHCTSFFVCEPFAKWLSGSINQNNTQGNQSFTFAN